MDMSMTLEELCKLSTRKITNTYRLEWMSDEDWAEIEWFYGCVCNYDIQWDNHEAYERWCIYVVNRNK